MSGNPFPSWPSVDKGSLFYVFRKPVQSNLSLRTPLYYGQFPMSRQNSHIFSFKKNLSNTDNGH